MLGVKGVKSWEAGKDWRKYMRGYAGLKEVGSRLAKLELPEEREESAKRKYEHEDTIISPDVKTNEYRRKFNNLGETSKVERAIFNQARDILNHRSGTNFEDLAYVDSKTGEALARIDYSEECRAKPSNQMEKWRKTLEPHTVIAIHNHPNSRLPSRGDIIAANDRGYKYGIIACHNGTVIKYTITARYNIDIVDFLLDQAQNALYYNKKETFKKLQERLAGEGLRIEVW